MLLDCKQCGAPLDVEQSAFLATCAYCKHTQTVRKSIYKRPTDWRQTPPNWLPPEQWTPPANARQPSVPLSYQPARAQRKSSLVRLLVLGAVVVATAGAGAGAWMYTSRAGSGSATGDVVTIDGPPGESWDGRSALRCDGPTTVSGRRVVAVTSPAVAVGPGCRLTITNAQIEADQLLAGDVAVTIANSELVLKRGLATSSNDIVVRGSTLTFDTKGGEPLLSTSGNGTITIDNTNVVAVPSGGGELVIARSTGNGDPTFRNATVRVQGAASPIVLFDTGGNGTGTFDNSTIDAGGEPVTLRTVRPATVSNATLNGSQLVGDPPAK